MSTSLILTVTLWGQCHRCHFTDEEMEAEELGSLSKVTPLVDDRAGLQTQGSWPGVITLCHLLMILTWPVWTDLFSSIHLWNWGFSPWPWSYSIRVDPPDGEWGQGLRWGHWHTCQWGTHSCFPRLGLPCMSPSDYFLEDSCTWSRVPQLFLNSLN